MGNFGLMTMNEYYEALKKEEGIMATENIVEGQFICECGGSIFNPCAFLGNHNGKWGILWVFNCQDCGNEAPRRFFQKCQEEVIDAT